MSMKIINQNDSPMQVYSEEPWKCVAKEVPEEYNGLIRSTKEGETCPAG